MSFYKQTEEYYKTQMLGFGSGSIYDYGCYLVSLCNGLNQFGHKYTPRTLNELFKDKGLYTGEFKNYINVDRLADVLPEIFEDYFKVEPWNSMSDLEAWLDSGHVVVSKVSAKGIGGSGTHFVLADEVQGINVIIHDPWTDEYQPVFNRYGSLGNILGLRVFKVKNIKEGEIDMPETVVVERSKFEELVTKSTKYDGFANEGYNTVEDVFKVTKELSEDLNKCQTELDKKVVPESNQSKDFEYTIKRGGKDLEFNGLVVNSDGIESANYKIIK